VDFSGCSSENDGRDIDDEISMSNPAAPFVFDTSSRRFYHGTRADLKPGDLLEPGYSSNYSESQTQMTSTIPAHKLHIIPFFASLLICSFSFNLSADTPQIHVSIDAQGLGDDTPSMVSALSREFRKLDGVLVTDKQPVLKVNCNVMRLTVGNDKIGYTCSLAVTDANDRLVNHTVLTYKTIDALADAIAVAVHGEMIGKMRRASQSQEPFDLRPIEPAQPSSLAEDVSPQKKALAGELITLLRLHESMQVVVRERLKTEELLNPYLSAEEKASRRRAIEKSYDIEAFKAVWAEIYAEIFTEDELKGMIAFFKGPAGGKWIEKQRELEEKTALRMRDFMRDAESKSGHH